MASGGDPICARAIVAPSRPRRTAKANGYPRKKTVVITCGAPSRKRRLAYHEKRELESLPTKIETLDLDAEVARLHQLEAQPEFYKQPAIEIARQQARLTDLEQRLSAAYRRWEELGHWGD